MNKLRAYRGFYKFDYDEISNCALIFAHSAKEAKKMFRRYSLEQYEFVDIGEYIEIKIEWIKPWEELNPPYEEYKPFEDSKLSEVEKNHIKNNQSFITSPQTCKHCGSGTEYINENGLCSYCAENLRDRMERLEHERIMNSE